MSFLLQTKLKVTRNFLEYSLKCWEQEQQSTWLWNSLPKYKTITAATARKHTIYNWKEPQQQMQQNKKDLRMSVLLTFESFEGNFPNHNFRFQSCLVLVHLKAVTFKMNLLPFLLECFSLAFQSFYVRKLMPKYKKK